MKAVAAYLRRLLIIVLSAICLSPGLAETPNGPIKAVYHIDDARNGRFALHIAKDQLQTNPGIRIAIVAYGRGIDFLLQGASDMEDEPYGPDVADLLRLGVEFKVCSATLRSRHLSEDQVLEGMQFVPAGTYEVIRLQAEDGYVYIKP